MLRRLCSASSIFPAVYSIKATTTTRKIEDPELKLFRMTPILFNGREQKTIRLRFPITTLGNDGMDKGLFAVHTAAIGALIKNKIYNKNPSFV